MNRARIRLLSLAADQHKRPCLAAVLRVCTSGEFVPTEDGIYDFLLMTMDDDGFAWTFTSDSVRVTVTNVAPTADAGPDQVVTEGSVVTLTGLGTDPGADALTYLWRLLNSTNGQIIADQDTASFEFTPTDNGTYTVTLTVTDDDGGSSTDTVVVTANNALPSAVPAACDRLQRANAVVWSPRATHHLPIWLRAL
jgi:hypothetical protein